MDFQFRCQDGCCFDKTNWHISVNLLARSSSGLRPGGDRYKAVGKWWFVVIIHFWQNKIDLAHNFLFASWESCVQICWFELSLNPNKIILTRCLDRYVAQQDQTAFPSLFSSTLCQTAPSKLSFPAHVWVGKLHPSSLMPGRNRTEKEIHPVSSVLKHCTSAQPPWASHRLNKTADFLSSSSADPA